MENAAISRAMVFYARGLEMHSNLAYFWSCGD